MKPKIHIEPVSCIESHPAMKPHPKLFCPRPGLSRLSILASIAIIALIALWATTYAWVGRSANQLIYEQNKPQIAADRLESFSPWMFSPSKWQWLRAEAYRKLGDRSRVQRISDELAAKGLPNLQANSPLILMEAAAGIPSRVKDNLGPLLILYKNHEPEVLSSLVQGFINQGDLSGASQTLRLWSELFDNDPKAEYWKGVHATTSYDLDTALQAFKRSISLAPEEIQPHQELAEVYVEKAMFEEARSEFEWLATRRPEAPDVITGLARSLLNLGYPDLASEQLQKLPDVSKLPSPELALVCETNLEADKAEVASQQATILLQRWPNALPYLQLQARCFAKLGKTTESESLFAKAAESQNRRPQVDRMIEQLATDSGNQEIRRDMGELMMNFLDPPGGVGYLQIASRANPFDLKTQDMLATYYQREGNESLADNHRKAIRRIQQAMLDAAELQEAQLQESQIQSGQLPTSNSPASTPAAGN